MKSLAALGLLDFKRACSTPYRLSLRFWDLLPTESIVVCSPRGKALALCLVGFGQVQLLLLGIVRHQHLSSPY